MAALTKDKIIEKLNDYFAEGYPYVFWYDPKREFNEEFIESLKPELKAKVYIAEKNHQFQTKLDLLQDTSNTQYLVYAPYERPTLIKNYWADMERYSKLFSADASQLVVEELGLDNSKLAFVKKYKAFFAAKNRRADFKKYWSKDFDMKPEYGILAAITKVERLEVNEFLMIVLSGGLESNHYLDTFAKYDVQDAFWELMEDTFAYPHDKPLLFNLLCSIMITYCLKDSKDLPMNLRKYILDNPVNAEIFIDRYADSNRYLTNFKEYTAKVWTELKLHDFFAMQSIDELVEVKLFDEINDLVLEKLRSRFHETRVTDYDDLLNIINKMTDSSRHNYSEKKKSEYDFLKLSAELFNMQVTFKEDWKEALQDYINQDYLIDTCYRKCLFNYTNIEDTDPYSDIKAQIDYYYSNELLDNSIKQWNITFDLNKVENKDRQERFYYNHVRDVRERVVVIFSDAFRFEVAKELQDELDSNDRLDTTMKYALTGLPSVTYTGMNIMLPHKELTFENGKVRVDGQSADGTQSRDKILKQYDENNLALQLKDILDMTSKEVKQTITGKNVIYLYHNQIDAKGHESKTTRELIGATEKAISEISQAIQTLRTNGITHIIVTADHGFIYQERQIEDSDKINLNDQTFTGQANSRYLITKDRIDVKGVKSATIGASLGNSDSTNVYYPTSKNIFVARGSQKNYVHGGSSLQEMLIPILDIKASSARSKAKPAEIKLAATSYKINNYKMNLLFNQVKAISDLVRPAKYRVYFTDDKGNIISNVAVVDADRYGSAPERTIQVTVTVQEASYDYNRDYFLVIDREGDNKFSKSFKYSMDLLQPR